LSLLRGFQVDGVDKVLLMKDRGRDGRVVIGSSADAHVWVDGADADVELFADRTGELRCVAPRDGEVDGRPFSGEAAVPAGAVVRCGRIAFTVVPRTGCGG
jgi:hypothetical protein